MISYDDGIKEIERLFIENVKGKSASLAGFNKKHDGKEGHWLEKQMGIVPNANNDADIFGFEMKKQTRGKTTFGDWSADYYIFKDKKYSLDRDQGFMPIFGKPNEKKHNRYSWSGEPFPKIYGYNDFGQRLLVDKDENILAVYNFAKDYREDKSTIVPLQLQQDYLVIAQWNKSSIKKKLEKKFNQRGWFRCEKNEQGIYTSLAIGSPINWSQWIKYVQSGEVYLDSGMHQGNSRNYSSWRANNSLWDSLIIRRID